MLSRLVQSLGRDGEQGSGQNPTMSQPNIDPKKSELVKKPSESKVVREAYRQAKNRFAALVKEVNDSNSGTNGSTPFPKELHIPGNQLQNELKILHLLWKSYSNDWLDLTFVDDADANLEPLKRSHEMVEAGYELHKTLQKFPVWMNYYKSVDELRVRVQDRAFDYVYFVQCLPGIRLSPMYLALEQEWQEKHPELYAQCEEELKTDPAYVKINNDAKVLRGDIPPSD